MVNVLDFKGVLGDGRHDDTIGLQAALDTGESLVCFPRPKHNYLISKALAIHSGQTLQADRDAVIRLADGACAHMLVNSDADNGNRYITVSGGIWDGNNAAQSRCHLSGGDCSAAYDPSRYLGVLLRFNNVTDLRIQGLTLKDPETFGMQLGNLRRFTIDDITFDYNMLKLNMDGVHLHGNCHQGVIKNLKGATNDDLLALNADDGSMFEMSRGPITDIEVDGIFADNGFTAVRLLSAGSKISRVHLRNIYGNYRYNGVSFTHHDVHPGQESVFEDIVIDGMFCSKSQKLQYMKKFEYGIDPTPFPLIWVASGTTVKTLHIHNIIRNEKLPGAAVGAVHVDEGARVDYLAMSNASIDNHTRGGIGLLVNHGTIRAMNLVNIFGRAEGGAPRGYLLSGCRNIEQKNLTNVSVCNFLGVEAKDSDPARK